MDYKSLFQILFYFVAVFLMIGVAMAMVVLGMAYWYSGALDGI